MSLNSIKYVGESAEKKAKEITRVVLGMAKRASIVFVSVEAVPVEDGNSDSFNVVVGSTGVPQSTLTLAVTSVILKSYPTLKFRVSAYLGVATDAG